MILATKETDRYFVEKHTFDESNYIIDVFERTPKGYISVASEKVNKIVFNALTDESLTSEKDKQQEENKGDRKSMKWITRDREAGNVIDEFNTYEEAKAAVSAYEADDERNGYYTPDFYETVPMAELQDVVVTREPEKTNDSPTR